MLLKDIEELVASTADPAFAVDGSGVVIAWNAACVALLGRSAGDAVGHRCASILDGIDASGPVCNAACCVLAAVQRKHSMQNFDLSVGTVTGRRWCNVSVMRAMRRGQVEPVSIHILRDVDTRKQLDLLMRQFVADGGAGPMAQPVPHANVERNAARVVALTPQQVTVLRLLATGTASADIAACLNISPATVNNHVQHAMEKLGAHTRLEAVRRADRAGLL